MKEVKKRWNDGGFCFRKGAKMMYGWTLPPPPRAPIFYCIMVFAPNTRYASKWKEKTKMEHMEYECWCRIVNENRTKPNWEPIRAEENRNCNYIQKVLSQTQNCSWRCCCCHLLYRLVSHLASCILFSPLYFISIFLYCLSFVSPLPKHLLSSNFVFIFPTPIIIYSYFDLLIFLIQFST